MSPRTTNIVLNPRERHSVTYSQSDDTITVYLPDPVPIQKLPNKRRLMLLVYFAQRDQDRSATNHRAIDTEVALDVRIVERLIWGFTNMVQANRTLREYTEVGGHVDTAAGMMRPRTEPDAFGKGTKAIKMTITLEIRDCILEWMTDILAPEVICPTTRHPSFLTSRMNIDDQPGSKRVRLSTFYHLPRKLCLMTVWPQLFLSLTIRFTNYPTTTTKTKEDKKSSARGGEGCIDTRKYRILSSRCAGTRTLPRRRLAEALLVIPASYGTYHRPLGPSP
jgi:hypothetical protein